MREDQMQVRTGRVQPTTDRRALSAMASAGRQQMSSPLPEERLPGDEVHAGTRRLIAAFMVLTLLAVNQLLVLADVTDRYWAWAIHVEPTAAFLGAAYAAGFVLSFLALRQDDWSTIRVPLITVTVFTLLTSVATLVHAHRLHLMSGIPVARVAAWVWLAVYLVIPVACLIVVTRQECRRGPTEAVARPMPGWLVAVLSVEGVVLLAAGACLFFGGLMVHHEPESMTGFWPWPLTPLSAQVIGAWLVAFGVAAALAVRQRDLSRLLVSAVTYTVFGVLELVVVLLYRPQLPSHGPWLWVYLAVLAAIVGTGWYGWRTLCVGDRATPARTRGSG